MRLSAAASSPEKSFFRSLGLLGTLVIGFLAVIMVLISVETGNPVPAIVVTVFAIVLLAFYFFAKRPSTSIGYPDRPGIAGPGGLRHERPGTKPVLILRDQCQYKGCKERESLGQCKMCHRTYCSYHLAHHQE